MQQHPSQDELDQRAFQLGTAMMAAFLDQVAAGVISDGSKRMCCEKHREIFTAGAGMALLGYAAHLAALCGQEPETILQAVRDAVTAAEPVRGQMDTARQAIHEANPANVSAEMKGRH